MRARDAWALLRPYHWYKNTIVYLAAIFSGRLLDPSIHPKLLLAVLTLSLVSSANYVLNDIRDADRDRLHPVKRKRPLASGRVSVGEALALAALLSLVSLPLSLALGTGFFSYAAALFLWNQVYSLVLRRKAPADTVAVSLNYVIRACAGAAVVGVEPSPWLIIGVFFLALTLILGKRRGELESLGPLAPEHKKALASYDEESLDRLIAMSSTMVVVTYAAYCAQRGTLFALTLPILTYAVMRYNILISKNPRVAEEPHLLAKDPGISASFLAWLALTLVLLYGPLYT